jgi:alanine racemase
MPQPPYYRATQIAQIVHGTPITNQYKGIITHIAYDTRRLVFPDTSVFFALITPKNNAHNFLLQAYHAGVRVFVVQRQIPYNNTLVFAQDATIIEVNNTLTALQQLAAYHRSLFSLPVVGITGSNGKTIVKDWLAHLLAPDFDVVKSPNSYNSQIGVPLSVWQLTHQHQFAIFEAGISKKNEMTYLQNIIQPNLGIFTNLGTAHAQGFFDDFEKACEKLELFTDCQKIFYSPDDVPVEQAITQFAHLYPHTHLHTWSTDASHTADLVLLQVIDNESFAELICHYKSKKIGIKTKFKDRASIENIMICTLFLLEQGYHLALIQKRLDTLQPLRMRLEQKQGTQHTVVINDGYSLDISSLAVALDYLNSQKQPEKHTVILSDILETNQPPTVIYTQVAALLAQYNIQKIVGIGVNISDNAACFENINEKYFFQNTHDFLKNPPNFAHETILIKGARKFEFEQIDRFLSEKMHETILEVNLDAMLHNYHYFKQQLRPQTKIMVMVKAFSYGSGSYQLANLLQYHKVDYLAVAYTDEGVKLRTAGIQVPIMVLNPEKGSFENIIKYDLEPVVYGFRLLDTFHSYLKQTSNLTKKLRIHIEIDTGMHRLGFDAAQIFELCDVLKNQEVFEVKSVFSHLAAADEPEKSAFTTQQIDIFNDCYKMIAASLNYTPLRHIANTAGIVGYPAAHLDMVRLGIGLHGIDSAGAVQAQLRQVSTLKTTISQVRNVKKGETIGYNRKGIVMQNSRIATLAIGYADGISRACGNGVAEFWVEGVLAPTIGSICMDMCMIDITHIPTAGEGTEVVIFGENHPIQRLCAQTNIIPYEMLTNVSDRVKRIYIKE